MLKRSAKPEPELSARTFKASPQEAKNVELAGRSLTELRESAQASIELAVKRELEEEVRKGAAELIEEQRKVVQWILEEGKGSLRLLIEEDKKEIVENREALRHSILENAEAFRQSILKIGL
jgi:hypothetical protein